LSKQSTTPTTVTLKLTGVTAELGTDTGTVKVSTNGGTSFTDATVNPDGTITVNVPANAPTNALVVQLPTVVDTFSEGAETVKLTGSTPQNTTPAEGTGTINDGNGLPQLSINDVTVNEAAGVAVYTVTLSNPSSSAVTVNYGTQNGTATAGSDFTNTAGSLTFAPGETTKTISVPITNDNVFEGIENYTVVLSGASANAQIADGSGLGGINDQGGPTTPPPGPNTPPTTPDDDRPSIGVSSPTVTEGELAVFTVSLSKAASAAQTYQLSLANGSATQPQDYLPAMQVSFNNGTTWTTVLNGQVSVPAGQTSFLTRVATVNDSATESTETFRLTVSSPIAVNGSATGTASIVDNDAPPAIDLDGNNSSGATGTGYNTAYTEKGAPVRLGDVDVSISDADSTQLTGATIKLTNPQAGDTLSQIGNLPAGITATINGSVVTLTGTASLSAYQSAIREIGYSSTSNNPSTESRVVEVTVTDGTSTSNTAVTTIQVTAVNDAPVVVSASSGSVSEEGLANGIADTDGSPDTTNSTSFSGKILVSDAEGDATTLSVTGPSGIKTLDNLDVVWVSDGQGGLIGKAGTAANAATVATLNISANGDYTFNLQAPLKHSGAGEDALSLTFNVQASDGKPGGVGTGSFTISVEDDAPSAAASQIRDATVFNTNLMIVLDTSGSMVEADGINGTTRLASAIQSINTLLDKYDGLGDVRVRLVTFSTHADAVGAEWTTVAAAKQLLATLASQAPVGGTNYDEALSDAMAAFNSTGKLADGQNVSYFISDGEPTYGSGTTSQLVSSNVADPSLNGTGRPGQTGNGAADLGIQANEEALWKNFLIANKVDSYALGVGGLTPAQRTFLDPISYDGRSVTDRNGVIVSAFSQLDSVLAETVPTPISGNLLSGSFLMGGAGADGPAFVRTLVVNGVTYTYDPTNGGSVTVSGGTNSSVFDTTTDTLTITTRLADGSLGGKFIVDMDGGDYRYEVPGSVPAGGISEVMNFVVSDRDGDTSGAALTVNVSKPNIINGTAAGETLTGTAGVDFIAGGDGNDTLIGNAGDDKLFGNNGDDNLQGGAGNDVLSGGAGNDIVLGGDGNDVLLGGAGNDALTGGAGSDVFQWSFADAGTGTTTGRAVDTIKDFNVASASSGGDVLDLRDLLSGENTAGGAGNLQNYLDFDTTSTAGSTIIRVSPTGGFTNGTYAAGSDTQRIVLEGVDIRTGLGLANNASDTQIITKLLQDGKLLVDNS
ncbi:MAG: type I secretion C-terminal target domain-containing protein, partial [Rubrivivax sp.]